MAIGKLQKVKIVGSIRKESLKSLDADELRGYMRTYLADKDFIMASYISRLLIMRGRGL